MVDRDGSIGQQRVFLLTELALVGLDLNLCIGQAVLVECCWDIFWHQNPGLLQILLRPALLGTEERSHSIARRGMKLLECALTLCSERGSLRLLSKV